MRRTCEDLGRCRLVGGGDNNLVLPMKNWTLSCRFHKKAINWGIEYIKVYCKSDDCPNDFITKAHSGGLEGDGESCGHRGSGSAKEGSGCPSSPSPSSGQSLLAINRPLQ